jgi:uncharacterized protein (TIGR03435 family)
MQEFDNIALLRSYAEDHSEDAFATLVNRHIDKVYSAALRHTGNTHQAEEIAQAVFVILAQKAKRLGKGVILEGWLYQTARLTALTFIRSEIRRARREQEAHMQNNSGENEADVWSQITPLLDAALAALNDTDRNAVVLRFFYGKSMREIGAALGANEDTARMRVNRAVERLRNYFSKRGVNSTATAIVGAISVNSIRSAPTTLAKTATAMALAKGTTASTSTSTLIKGALKIMAWTKAKTAIVTGAVILLAAGTTTVAVTKIAAHRTLILSTTDLSWADDPKYWATDSRVLDKLPAGVYIFRPTRFPRNGGSVWNDSRVSAKNQSVSNLIDDAYGFSAQRTVFPVDMPDDHFDVMVTMPNYNGLMKDELKKRYGLSAHTETRETDVLVLKVQNPNPPNLKPHRSNGVDDWNSSWIGGNGKVTIRNMPPGGFFTSFESQLNTPVIDETGLTGNYDFSLQWHRARGESDNDAFKRALLDQLGLEFVPDRRPIKMLIVDKNDSF